MNIHARMAEPGRPIRRVARDRWRGEVLSSGERVIPEKTAVAMVYNAASRNGLVSWSDRERRRRQYYRTLVIGLHRCRSELPCAKPQSL